MEYEQFKVCCDYMYHANVAQAHNYLCSKSETWLKENIPLTTYSEDIYAFIVSTDTCIDITEEIRVYEVNGQWQRITNK
jgi:hypothetical protein